jgi:pimeloyl-ACP methyl ester carboxylesterase
MQLLEKTIDVDGHKIFYLEGGKPSDQKHPILFLHGWGLSSKTFQAGLSILSRNHHILAPDLPGFGKSGSSTSHWSFEDYARVIQSFIEAKGLKCMHLMGQSLGGGVSIMLATLAPSLVYSLTLIDSVGFPLAPFSTIFLQRLVELPAQTLATKFTLHHINMVQAFLYNSILRTKNIFNSLRLSLSVDLRPILGQVNVPCLIIWGANDRTIPLTSGRELKQAIKNAKLIVIENAHHEWSALMPEKFASVVSEFVMECEQTNK